MTSTDTIFALSSGRLPSGVAVIRISGPNTRFVTETMAGGMGDDRCAVYRVFRTPDGDVIDRGLVTLFEGPRSFTGEDCAELGLHGGRAVVARILDLLSATEGLRMAEPGEFTRRAMLNGKVDLVEAEALADLIGAETEAQRRFAVANADGRQSALYEEWRRRIIFGRAMLEAELDFADEGDVPGSVADQTWADMAALAQSIEAHAAGYKDAEIIRDGFRVVILGAPNAGKSSLLNALARREVAIVTDEPGTTRDLVEIALDLAGAKVLVTDTAGLREGAAKVERIGIERAVASARSADLVLMLTALDEPIRISSPGADRVTLEVGSKVDRLSAAAKAAAADKYGWVVSSTSGDGLDALVGEIGARAARAIDGAGDILPSRARHAELLARAASGLRRALASDAGIEMRAEELRQASDALGRIVGSVDVEDLLDAIFSEFCIGK